MILDAHDGISTCGIALNGTNVLEFLQTNHADIILMDINMPVLNGYETTRRVTKEFPDVHIIALSMISDKASMLRMLEAGARGYIFKNAGEEELLEAIQTVMQDGYYVSNGMQHVLQEFERSRKDIEKGYKRDTQQLLSRREIEILKLIIEGHTNTEIAEQLFLSNRTVDTHRKNILAKLELKNTAALVKYAVENKAFLGIDGAS